MRALRTATTIKGATRARSRHPCLPLAMIPKQLGALKSSQHLNPATQGTGTPCLQSRLTPPRLALQEWPATPPALRQRQIQRRRPFAPEPAPPISPGKLARGGVERSGVQGAQARISTRRQPQIAGATAPTRGGQHPRTPPGRRSGTSVQAPTDPARATGGHTSALRPGGVAGDPHSKTPGTRIQTSHRCSQTHKTSAVRLSCTSCQEGKSSGREVTHGTMTWRRRTKP